jgi:DNA polymerase III delta subunit
MLILMTGPDSFLVRSEIDKIRTAHDPEGFNSSTIDARSTSVEEIVLALGTPGFFGDVRVIVVTDLMARSSKKPGAELSEDDSPAQTGSVDWQRIFDSIQPANVAVFADRTLWSVPTAVKKHAPGNTITIACEPMRGVALITWIKERAALSQANISDAHARLLAETLCPSTWSAKPSNPAYDRPPDLDQFANEIAKLAMAAFPGEIEKSHIEEMTASSQSDRLFPLVDAVVAGDAQNAVRELAITVGDNDDIGRSAVQLYQQAELMAALSAAGRIDPADAGRQLGLTNPNRMVAVSRSLRRLRQETRPLLTALLETERQFKTGLLRQPVDQLYSMVDRTISPPKSTQDGGN